MGHVMSIGVSLDAPTHFLVVGEGCGSCRALPEGRFSVAVACPSVCPDLDSRSGRKHAIRGRVGLLGAAQVVGQPGDLKLVGLARKGLRGRERVPFLRPRQLRILRKATTQSTAPRHGPLL